MAKIRKSVRQNITLQMQNYEDQMTKALFDEYNEERSYDLILKTGPEKFETSCHRIILALSSDFLRKIIATATAGTTPVIILPDIKTSVVKYLLLYMYKGEVEVPPDVKTDFIEACNLLELKGPISNNNTPKIPDFLNTDDEIHLLPKCINEMVAIPEPGEIQNESVFFADQDMEYNGMEDDSNDFMYQQPEGNYIEGSSDAIYNANDSGTAQLPRRRRKHQKRQNKISVTPKQIVDVTQRLKNIIRSLYDSLEINYMNKPDGNKLILENDKLLEAEHCCAICGRAIGVSYSINKRTSRFEAWINTSVRNHLMNVHNLKPPVRIT